MRISVIGCGYVGLVTGACLAEIGHHVLCADWDEAIIRRLNVCHLPVYEPHLEGIVTSNLRAGRLAFTSDPAEAVRSGDDIFICVGVPQLESGEADLSALDGISRLIATESRSPKFVIVKSTVPVQTGEQLKHLLSVYGRKAGLSFRVASNPQFLREGTAVEDFLHPERILVGVEEKSSEQQLSDIYRPILERRFRCPIHAPACPPLEPPRLLVTGVKSAELIKHASNAFLALKISYVNAIADLCERLGGDVEEVTRAMGLDPRIGRQFLRAGLGFGGFRLPKDTQAFIRLADRVGVDFGLLKEAERVNKRRIDQFIEKIRRAVWVIKDKQIGILGLAFKPNTDDIRVAPSIEVINRLLAEGARVRACDPEAMDKTRALFPELECNRDPYAVAQGADALLIVTEWEEFRQLDWKRVRDRMARPLVIDGRNLLEPTAMKALGFEYHSFGRSD